MHSREGVAVYKKALEDAVAQGGTIECGGKVWVVISFSPFFNMNLLGYTYKIYNSGYNTDMNNKPCNTGDPLETPGGLYRGPPSMFKMLIQYKSCACETVNKVDDIAE